MPSTVPHTTLLEFTFQAPKRIAPIQIDGDLGEWSEETRIPDLMHLRGAQPFAQVYLTWDDANLYLALQVAGKQKAVTSTPRRFWRADSIEVWFDLRNEKLERRYNEHCHHFFMTPKGRGKDKVLAVAGACHEAGSALAETTYDHPEIEVASTIHEGGYALEARIPQSAMPTYDPSQHPLLGFNYHINDTDRRAQWWNCGNDFSRHTDPSTWGCVELVSIH